MGFQYLEPIAGKKSFQQRTNIRIVVNNKDFGHLNSFSSKLNFFAGKIMPRVLASAQQESASSPCILQWFSWPLLFLFVIIRELIAGQYRAWIFLHFLSLLR